MPDDFWDRYGFFFSFSVELDTPHQYPIFAPRVSSDTISAEIERCHCHVVVEPQTDDQGQVSDLDLAPKHLCNCNSLSQSLFIKGSEREKNDVKQPCDQQISSG